MIRGIIASPLKMDLVQDGSFDVKGNLSNDELRYFILYWDKVVIPGNNIFYMRIPDEDQLIKTGAIERPLIGINGKFSGNQVREVILRSQGLLAKELLKDKKTDWVIHQIGEERSFPEGFKERRNIIRLDLSSMFPVPIGEINIDDLLEFKLRRKDELKELHSYLDSLYETILSSPDQDLASKRVISDLSSALSNLDQVTKERFKLFKKFDFSIELNLKGKDIATSIASGAAFDFFTPGIEIPLASVAFALMSTLSIKSKASNTFQPANKRTKLSYLSRCSEEGIINKCS